MCLLVATSVAVEHRLLVAAAESGLQKPGIPKGSQWAFVRCMGSDGELKYLPNCPLMNKLPHRVSQPHRAVKGERILSATLWVNLRTLSQAEIRL